MPRGGPGPTPGASAPEALPGPSGRDRAARARSGTQIRMGADGTVITVRGRLDEQVGTAVARLVERALMAEVPRVVIELRELHGFDPEGVAELAQAVAVGNRLPGGVALDARGRQAWDALLEVCRWRVDQRVREEAAGPNGPR